MEDLALPHAHTELVDALLELATSTSAVLNDLTRAHDVADRAAAVEFLREAFHELLAPVSLLLGPRDLRAATTAIEAAANLAATRLDFAPCEAEADVPRRDPRSAHRRPRPPVPRRRGTRY
jgi:hypothetical protein